MAVETGSDTFDVTSEILKKSLPLPLPFFYPHPVCVCVCIMFISYICFIKSFLKSNIKNVGECRKSFVGEEKGGVM